MLPEHYCDYLLTLYTEGNPPGKDKKAIGKSVGILFQAVAFLAMLSFAVFVTYFTELSFILQIGLLIFLVVSGLGIFFYFSRKGLFSHLALASSALIFLLLSEKIASNVFGDSSESLYLLMALNCVGWLAIGWKKKLLYFSIAGILGLGVIVFFIFA